MMHMPSLESIASSITLADSEGYVPSIATSSYQSDMARSHSLLSSFSVASFSTAASSVASTSKSILDRKRPLPSRAVSSNNDKAQVIKLRSRRTYQRPIQGDVGSEFSLIRRDTKMSIVSQKASIHCASPTADELDCMVFEPMQPLPSPTMYSSENQESPCTCGSQSDIGVTSPSEEARNALFEIWTAAEEMERQRKLKKRQPIKQTRPAPSDSNTQRVHKWVSKVRKSASLGNLRARASGDDALNVVEDPIAWAEGNNSKPTVVESGREELMEPRSAREEKVKGIEQVLDQSCVGNTMRIVQSAPKVRQEVIAGHIWDFLG